MADKKLVVTAFDSHTANSLDLLIGYTFADVRLRDAALTHSSWLNEHGDGNEDYERLEFLGDAALQLLTSRALLAAFPGQSEGFLSRQRAQLVRQESLAAIARTWGLAPHVRLGLGQMSTGLGPGILADVVEAMFGAVLLDGGLSACEPLFAAHFAGPLAALSESGAPDAKTSLQELCHRLRIGPPHYHVVATSGPAHARCFRVRLAVGGGMRSAPVSVERDGRSKKEAEQACAQAALTALRGGPPQAV